MNYGKLMTQAELTKARLEGARYGAWYKKDYDRQMRIERIIVKSDRRVARRIRARQIARGY